MRGKAQRDGLIAARWVDRNSGPIFRRLWIKVHLVVSQFLGDSVVCNAVFRSTIAF